MAIYYVSSLAVGGGDGTFLSPWTLQELADGTLAGDEGRIMADGIYDLTARIAFNQVAGTASSYPLFTGANASGTVDGTRPQIDGTNNAAANDLFLLSLTNLYARFEHLHFTNSKRHGVNVNQTAFLNFFDVIIDTCVNDGISISNTNSRVTANHSKVSNCQIGIGGTGGGNNQISVYTNCEFINCSDSGLRIGAANHISKCNFIRNGYGIRTNNTNLLRNSIDNCVFLKNTNDGINHQSGNINRVMITNSIFRRNGGYGINTNTSSTLLYLLYNNCFSNNTSGNVDINGGVLWGEGHVLADPLFESEVDGSEDITLQSGSPCLNAGLNPVGY